MRDAELGRTGCWGALVNPNWVALMDSRCGGTTEDKFSTCCATTSRGAVPLHRNPPLVDVRSEEQLYSTDHTERQRTRHRAQSKVSLRRGGSEGGGGMTEQPRHIH